MQYYIMYGNKMSQESVIVHDDIYDRLSHESDNDIVIQMDLIESNNKKRKDLIILNKWNICCFISVTFVLIIIVTIIAVKMN